MIAPCYITHYNLWSEWGAGPERDGMGSGWDGKFFRRRRRRRRRRREAGDKMGNHKIGLVFLEIGWTSLKNISDQRKIRIWDGDLSIARIDPDWRVSMFVFRAISFWINERLNTSILVKNIQQLSVFMIYHRCLSHFSV